MQYGRWPKPPKQVLPAQVQPSMQAPLNQASMLPRQVAASAARARYIASPAAKDSDGHDMIHLNPSHTAGLSGQDTMPGPSRQAVGQTLAPSHAISELSAPHQASVHSPSSPEPSMQDRRVGSFKQVIDQPMAPYHVMVKPPAFCQVVDQFEDVSIFFNQVSYF